MDSERPTKTQLIELNYMICIGVAYDYDTINYTYGTTNEA